METVVDLYSVEIASIYLMASEFYMTAVSLEYREPEYRHYTLSATHASLFMVRNYLMTGY